VGEERRRWEKKRGEGVMWGTDGRMSEIAIFGALLRT
jgi:hypothetical protein